MFRQLTSSLLALLVLSAGAASAATFFVPTDRQMIQRASAIVVGTVRDSRSRTTAAGGIETVTNVSVEETLKGVVLSASVDIVEPGGALDGRALLIPGVPQFTPDQRVLLFLVRTADNNWVVSELVLGKFRFARDVKGRQVVLRDEDEIVGWNPDFTPHRELRREAGAFLDFIRGEVRHALPQQSYTIDAAPLAAEPAGPRAIAPNSLQTAPNATFTANSYTFIINGSAGGRWNVFPNAVTFFTGTTQEPGAPGGGVTAVQTGIAAWNNDSASNVNYVYGGTDTGGHTAGLSAPDGANTVLFERNLSSYGIAPFSCNSSGYSGTLGIGGITNASGTHVFRGETFATTTEGDVEMNQGIANCTLLLSSGNWNSAVAHELGHTLGFRHADQNRNDNGPCSADPSLECSSSAIMTAVVTSGINATLQSWDQHAVGAVYAGASPPPPSKVRGDFNADGKADIFWRHATLGQDALWLMNGTTHTVAISNTLTDFNWVPVAFGDFNGDGKTDVFWRDNATSQAGVWFMNGATPTVFVYPTTLPPAWEVGAAGDVNGDGKDDVIWRNYQTGQDLIWLMNGTTFTSVAMPDVTDGHWRIYGSGDFNGDGKFDFFWYDPVAGRPGLWLMNGTTRTIVLFDAIPVEWKPVGFGDFNGDGKTDVLWRNTANGANTIWFMNGTTFTSAPVQAMTLDWTLGAVGDYNGDGKADIAWRNYNTGADAIWLMNGYTIATSGVDTLSDLDWKMIGPR